MRERLNSQGHDESQYIKPVFNPKTGRSEMPPIINPFRMAKGDITRNTDDKLESPEGLPRIMFTNGRIDKPHYDMAVCFERILIQALRTLGISDIKGIVHENFTYTGSSVDVDKFLEIKRRLPRKEFGEIIWFVSYRIKALSAALPMERLQVILNGLELSKKVIDEITEQSNNAISTPP